ncbi:MAG: hypothetical protein JWM52_792 [Candidatus Saccharibacteria bacterium]|nr:hypothetical protein [Candidatus Saccharibacteria bacterium]
MVGQKFNEASDGSSFNTGPYYELDSDLLVLSEIAPKGEELTFGATPLDRLLTIGSQKKVRLELQKLLLSIPGEIPLNIASYIRDTFDVRFNNRAKANDENFMTALRYDALPLLDVSLSAIVERARLGTASPAELLLVRDQLGIRSIELACLTHPYGEHEESLASMHKAVSYAVDLFGGNRDDSSESRFRVKEAVGDEGVALGEDDLSIPAGLLMTRKRTLATLPDGTIVRERSSFVLRTDTDSRFYKEFGEEGVAMMRMIQTEEGVIQEKLLEPYKEFIEELSLSKKRKNAISMSSTIYAYNPETAREVTKQQEELQSKNVERAHLPRQYYFPGEDHGTSSREIQERLDSLTFSNQLAAARNNPDMIRSPEVQAFFDNVQVGKEKESPLRRLMSRIIKRP